MHLSHALSPEEADVGSVHAAELLSPELVVDPLSPDVVVVLASTPPLFPAGVLGLSLEQPLPTAAVAAKTTAPKESFIHCLIAICLFPERSRSKHRPNHNADLAPAPEAPTSSGAAIAKMGTRATRERSDVHANPNGHEMSRITVDSI
jgi:hypothetical protein